VLSKSAVLHTFLSKTAEFFAPALSVETDRDRRRSTLNRHQNRHQLGQSSPWLAVVRVVGPAPLIFIFSV